MNPFSLGFSATRFRLAWILVAIGLLNGLFWTLYRWNWENSYTSTQITVDYEDTRSLSDAYGIPQEKLLSDFKARGASGIVIYNQTLGTLRDNARVAISPREIAQKVFPQANWNSLGAGYRYVVTSTDKALLDRIYPRLQEQAQGEARPREFSLGDGTQAIAISNSKQLLNDVQLGFDPQHIALANKEGYEIVARLSNPINLTPARLDQLLDDVKNDAKAKIVLFGDDEVLGYETLISSVARAMRKRGLIFTNVEFSKQRGGPDFAKNTEGQLVRVHTVTADEAVRAEPEVLVDRFIRGAKDRNMRMLYMRLLRQQKGEPVDVEPGQLDAPLTLEKRPYEQNLEFIEKISQELTRAPLPLPFLRPALSMGVAEPFGDYPNAPLQASLGNTGARIARYLMLFLSGLGTVGLTLLVLNLFFDWSARARRNWLIAGVLLVAVLSLSQGIGAKLMALETGIMVPIVAMLWGGLPLVWDGLWRPKNDSLESTLWFGFRLLMRTTLFTVMGALIVVALMNHWRYMSKADEFLGEKATQFLPLLIIPLAFLGEVFPHRVAENGSEGGSKAARQRVVQRVNKALDRPFTAKIAVGSILLLGVGYLWMARFGNDSGMQISSFELSMRAMLEKVFIARPRTKEIFMGHPAFLAVILLLLYRYRWVAWGALVFATIGQADVLNTMCHIHTPVFYGVWRSVTGVFIGTFVGFFVLWALKMILDRRGKSVASSEPPVTSTA